MMTRDFLDLYRQKLDLLSTQIPEYQGSSAQRWNENNYAISKMMVEKQEAARAAAEAQQDNTTTIIVKGAYKAK